MASINHLLQGLSNTNDHLFEFEKIMQLKNIKSVFLSVAYVCEGGVELIENLLKPFNKKIELFVGIRNGVTSAQALKRLIKNKVKLTLVDTASTSTIFHPKIFLTYSDKIAKIIIGSANLTTGGLIRNIEASTLIELDLANKDDKAYLNDLINNFKTLERNHPKNIFQITKVAQINKLLDEGRLSDEYKIVRPIIAGNKKKENSDDIDKIKLLTRHIKSKIIQPKTPKIGKRKKARKISHIEESSWNLLWKSKPLTERDLNVPSGGNTNPTGSMLLKQGNLENIDQRHYFREDIFNELSWHLDEIPSKSHLERATALFQIIVKGISFGVFNLRLTHNTRTDTKSYHQSNAMTQLHWGDAKEVVAKKHLLGCTLRLYKPIKEDDSFIIDIE